jgi:hypothetical protein
MRIPKTLAVLAIVTLATACASQKEPAEAAVQGMESTVAAARPEIERFAADQWPAIDEAAAAVRRKLTAGDYAGVLADAPGVHAKVAAAASAVADRKAALVQEWGGFSGIPAMVQQVAQKVAEITTSRRLPAGMDRAALAGAQATLSRVTGMMAEASKAYESGDLAAAVAKAREIKNLVEPLMATLGLTPAGM